MEYLRPTDIQSALDAAASGARIAAGCTDLFPATERPSLELAYGAVVDLTALDSLRGVEETEAGWRIGATTTWTDVIAADLPPAFDALKLAAREVGSVQIQNAGTIGGNLCNASPAADGAPPLLILDAEVELTSSAGARRLPLAEFLKGPRRTALAAGEILTAVVVPRAAGAGRSTFLKLGARKYLVISIVMVAARIDVADGLIREAALAIGSCGPVAARLAAAEAALCGAPATPDAAARVTDTLATAALSPIDDIRGDTAYRDAAAGVVARRAVRVLTSAEGVET